MDKNLRLIISPSPHIKSDETALSINVYTMLAMLLLWLWDIQSFGIGHLYVALVAAASCVFFEFMAQKFVFKTKIGIANGHSVLTGFIMAYFMSPLTPFYQVVICSFFAVFIAKECFGGIGNYIFNPAAVGIAVLVISYPDSIIKTGMVPHEFARCNMDFFNTGFAVVGAAALFYFRVVSWHIPLFYYAGIFAASVFFGVPVAGHMLNYGNVMAALFIATDHTSSPMFKLGKILFGFVCGVLAFMIVEYGAYSEGVCFAVLIMNIFVPIMDKYTKPRVA